MSPTRLPGDLKRPAPKGLEGLAVGALAAVTVLATAWPMLRATEEDATRNAIELIEIAYAEARTLAIRHGQVAVLHIDSDADRLWVEVDTTQGASGTPTVARVVQPPAVEIVSDRTMLCFDPRGRLVTGGDCQLPPGLITVMTRTGERSLLIDAQGRLLHL
jgi:hypothetical protein